MMNKPFLQAMLAFLLLFLAACAPSAGPAAPTQPPAEEAVDPTDVVPPTGFDFSSLDPNEILLQMDYEPTFSLPQFSYPFGRVPVLTLLASGQVVYTDENNNQQVMTAQLTDEEAASLLEQMWNLGYGDIETYTEMCIDRGNGSQECVADASYTILRARDETGELRETKNYANFTDSPEAFQAITDMLTFYVHPEAELYQPEGATLFVQQYQANGNAKMVRKLEEAAPTTTGPLPLSYDLIRDDAMHGLGVGTTRDMKSIVTGVFLPSWFSPQYTLGEKMGLWRGKVYSARMLRNHVFATDVTQLVTKLELPVYFFCGKYDYTVNSNLSKDYFEKLQAPMKGFYTFEQSAHSPVFEEPEKVRQILREDVLAVAEAD